MRINIELNDTIKEDLKSLWQLTTDTEVENRLVGWLTNLIQSRALAAAEIRLKAQLAAAYSGIVVTQIEEASGSAETTADAPGVSEESSDVGDTPTEG